MRKSGIKRGNDFEIYLNFTQREKMVVEDRWFQGSFYLMLLLQAAGEDVSGWESHINRMIIDYCLK